MFLLSKRGQASLEEATDRDKLQCPLGSDTHIPYLPYTLEPDLKLLIKSQPMGPE